MIDSKADSDSILFLDELLQVGQVRLVAIRKLNNGRGEVPVGAVELPHASLQHPGHLHDLGLSWAPACLMPALKHERVSLLPRVNTLTEANIKRANGFEQSPQAYHVLSWPLAMAKYTK